MMLERWGDKGLRNIKSSEEAAAAGAPIQRLGKAAKVAEAVLWLIAGCYRLVAYELT